MDFVDPWADNGTYLTYLSAPSANSVPYANWKETVLSRFKDAKTEPQKTSVQFLVFTGNNWCSVCQEQKPKMETFLSAFSSDNASKSLPARIEQASGGELHVIGVTPVDFPSKQAFGESAKHQELPGGIRITSVPSIFVVSRYVTAGPFITRLDLETQALAFSVAGLLATHRATRKMAARAAILERWGKITKEPPESRDGRIWPKHLLYVQPAPNFQAEAVSAPDQFDCIDLQNSSREEIKEECQYLRRRASPEELVLDLFAVNSAVREGMLRWRLVDLCFTALPLSSLQQLLVPQNLWEQAVREIQLALPIPKNQVQKS